MNILLKVLGVFGVVLFGVLLGVTYLSPKAVEDSAKNFIKGQIEKEVRTMQAALTESTAVQGALSIAHKLGIERKQIQSNLDDHLPQKIANIIASMCDFDCEKKKNLVRSITSSYLEQIKSIQIADSTLSKIVKGKYLEIVSSLRPTCGSFLAQIYFCFSRF